MIGAENVRRSCNIAMILVSILLSACQTSTHSKSVETTQLFDAASANNNLVFATDQYIKMIRLVESEKNVLVTSKCSNPQTCAPRAMEHNKILLEQRDSWTNGFYPGVLWMLLNHKAPADQNDHQVLKEKALLYTNVILDQAERTDTHDLGMIVHFPLAYALQNHDLPEDRRKAYENALTTGRNNLATRFSNAKGVFKSWDWSPKFYTNYINAEGKKRLNKNMDLANPWQYPVIVDNMMNLEFLYTSDNSNHRRIGFQHANTTMDHHFFYEHSDDKKNRPIAYHVFDYEKHRPGNWQGLGHESAWARGQGWALYGFVASAIYAKQYPQAQPDDRTYEPFVEKIYQTLAHLLEKDKVPLWDYFADRDNAYTLASDTNSNMAGYHNLLGLCNDRVPVHSIPYSGYNPITFSQNLLSKGSLEALHESKNLYGTKFLQHNDVVPCGLKPFPSINRNIPRDTSAAALYAGALYRMASFVSDNDEKSLKYEALADNIMSELTSKYRTDKHGADKNRGSGYKLGFVLDSATGNLPRGKEIDTPIVYADYFFIEANIFKLRLVEKRAQQ